MEVSTQFYICTYCVFYLVRYGRSSVDCFSKNPYPFTIFGIAGKLKVLVLKSLDNSFFYRGALCDFSECSFSFKWCVIMQEIVVSNFIISVRGPFWDPSNLWLSSVDIEK